VDWKDKRQKGDLYNIYVGKVEKIKNVVPNTTIEVFAKSQKYDQRPSIVEERKRFGDLEIDSIIGKNRKSALMTINDRTNRTLMDT